MLAVAGLVCNNVSEYWAAKKGHIADDINNFMPHEFIIVPQSLFVQNTIFVHADGILKRGAKG